MNFSFRKIMMGLALGATALSAAPALADPPSHGGYHDDRGPRGDRDGYGRHDNGRHEGEYRRDYAQDRRYDRRDDRRAYYRRPPVRVVHVYDYDRPDPRYHGYYANRYYRTGYAPIRVTRGMRIYRGMDDRYYCRRSDGTTGMIVGAALGGVIGNRLDRGQSGVVGTLLGASAGALLGRDLDRGSIVCR